MKKAFDKILDRLEEPKFYISCLECQYMEKCDELEETITNEKKDLCAETMRAIAKEIVQEVAEEYKGDMKHNLAEMYAKNMVDYGVDVTKAWQTATQQSYALEKAYIRGRQYEADRFIELRKEYNNGWIACSDRLPEECTEVLVSVKEIDGSFYTRTSWVQDGVWVIKKTPLQPTVIAWQPLPEPYK